MFYIYQLLYKEVFCSYHKKSPLFGFKGASLFQNLEFDRHPPSRLGPV